MDMKPFILQMCAARLGQSDNPAAAQLLARMNATDGTPPPEVHELLDGLAAQDPAMRILAQHFEAMQNARAEQEAHVTIDGTAETPTEPARAAWDAQVASVLELRSQIESMFEELNALRMRNDDLASALGACAGCWGEDRQCRACRGRGCPGFSKPETEAFLHYVVPAGKTWRFFRSLEKNGAGGSVVRRGTN